MDAPHEGPAAAAAPIQEKTARYMFAFFFFSTRGRRRPSVPIVGAFDLHGNISAECVAAFDFMVPVW